MKHIRETNPYKMGRPYRKPAFGEELCFVLGAILIIRYLWPIVIPFVFHTVFIRKPWKFPAPPVQVAPITVT